MVLAPKIAKVMALIRGRAESGNFIILPHAVERSAQRVVQVADIVFVLINGEHESEKDEYKAVYRSWNYAVRGLTVDKRQLRIAVAFDENEMLIVTVIRLGKKRK